MRYKRKYYNVLTLLIFIILLLIFARLHAVDELGDNGEVILNFKPIPTPTVPFSSSSKTIIRNGSAAEGKDIAAGTLNIHKKVEKPSERVKLQKQFSHLRISHNILISRNGQYYNKYTDTLPANTKKNNEGKYNLIFQIYSAGLGNRMFVYASGYGVAKKTNRTFVYHVLGNQLLAGVFNLYQKDFLPSSHKFENYFNLDMTSCCSFSKDLLDLPEENIIVKGYHQSWKYFHDYRNDILKQFQFNKDINVKAKLFLNEITRNKNVRLIGIHIRRGDMMKESNKVYGHAVADKNYLDGAISYFNKKYNCIFVVASQDMNWSKGALKEYSSQIVFSEGHDAALDLAILSLCNDVIITVGTFGWWAGYLSGGEVIYYKDWPRKGSTFDKFVNKDDYFPPHWIAM